MESTQSSAHLNIGYNTTDFGQIDSNLNLLKVGRRLLVIYNVNMICKYYTIYTTSWRKSCLVIYQKDIQIIQLALLLQN